MSKALLLDELRLSIASLNVAIEKASAGGLEVTIRVQTVSYAGRGGNKAYPELSATVNKR